MRICLSSLMLYMTQDVTMLTLLHTTAHYL